MSEMNITIGETNKRHGRLKTVLLAFAIVAALIVTPVVTAESASAATQSGYTVCGANKKSGVKTSVQGEGYIELKNYVRTVRFYSKNVTIHTLVHPTPTVGWLVNVTKINYAYNACK